jgi:hypothetical protein
MIRIFDYLRIVTNVDSSLNRGLDGSLASAHGYLARSLGIPEMCAREGKSACSLGSDPKCLTDNRGIHVYIHTYMRWIFLGIWTPHQKTIASIPSLNVQLPLVKLFLVLRSIDRPSHNPANVP